MKKDECRIIIPVECRKRLCGHNDKFKHACRICSPDSFCPHDRRKNNCFECKGTSTCEHDKRKDNCRQCNPCPHGRVKYHCKE